MPGPTPEARVAAAPDDAVLTFTAPREAPQTLCARNNAGGVVWSVDPERWIRGLLAEDYVLGWRRPLPSRVPFLNYSRAPFAWKRALVRLQDPSRAAPPPPIPFPELPLDDLADALARLRGVDPLHWPGGARAAVSVTHDVDAGWILEPARADLLARIVDGECELGFRGAWYVVADQLRPARHERALARLRDAGHELGAHGWSHDGRLQYLPRAQQVERMDRIARRCEGLGVRGMRTPWYARSPELFAAIAERFAYDTSVPNASGFFSARTRSGCCTLFPYAPRPGLVELPMTLPPDTAVPLPERGAALGAVADAIIARGGLVVVTLHPQPHQSGHAEGVAAHLGFLRSLRQRHGAKLWCATPAEIAEHCRAWAELCCARGAAFVREV